MSVRRHRELLNHPSSRPRLQPPGLAPPAVTHPIVKVFLGGISVSVKVFLGRISVSVTCSRKHLRWSISQPSLDPLAQVDLDPPVTCHSPMLPLPLVPGPVAQGQGSLQPVSLVRGLPLNQSCAEPQDGSDAGGAREMTVPEQYEREPLDCDS